MAFQFHSITHSNDERIFNIYKLTECSSLVPAYAIAVGFGAPMGKNNKLKDLPAYLELELLNYHADKIIKYRNENTKFIFVIDLTNFPFVGCSLDLRNPNDDADDHSQFGQDCCNAWNNYDAAKVITIIVNIHKPFVGLKLIPFTI